ncbi:transposase [Scytonema sp. UIC 10036]|uniref:DUF6262 family protein n=1 Tax=Scytonema sp. UIC 10036 TaxID=2304196 RepID=UPI0012DA26D1|nr:DUF6262 family protein [Scytonema sp. UIC 10036]MUG91614.1 transposase [Scytonema sp. UIC 10036]
MSKEDLKEARIKTLTETQLARKQKTLEKVLLAIERLQKNGAKINFQTIAKEANVSVPYLYKYPELKAHIAQIRNQQSSMPTSPTVQPPVTAKAHSQIVERLKKRLSEFEQENTELKRHNVALAGQVYRVHSLLEQVERQKQIIETLQNRLKEETQPTNESKVVPLSQNSQPVSDSISSELKKLNIQINQNLIKQIKAVTESDVLAAIEYYKYEQSRTNIDNPGGWLARAIKERWKKPENAVQPKSQSQGALSQPEILSQNQPDRELVSLSEIININTIFEESSDD